MSTFFSTNWLAQLTAPSGDASLRQLDELDLRAVDPTVIVDVLGALLGPDPELRQRERTALVVRQRRS